MVSEEGSERELGDGGREFLTGGARWEITKTTDFRCRGLTCFSADSNSASAPILSPAAYLARPCATRSAALEVCGEEEKGDGDEAWEAKTAERVDGDGGGIARPRGGPCCCRLSTRSRGRGIAAAARQEEQLARIIVGAGIAAAAAWRGRSSCCGEGSMESWGERAKKESKWLDEREKFSTPTFSSLSFSSPFSLSSPSLSSSSLSPPLLLPRLCPPSRDPSLCLPLARLGSVISRRRRRRGRRSGGGGSGSAGGRGG